MIFHPYVRTLESIYEKIRYKIVKNIMRERLGSFELLHIYPIWLGIPVLLHYHIIFHLLTFFMSAVPIF